MMVMMMVIMVITVIIAVKIMITSAVQAILATFPTILTQGSYYRNHKYKNISFD